MNAIGWTIKPPSKDDYMVRYSIKEAKRLLDHAEALIELRKKKGGGG